MRLHHSAWWLFTNTKNRRATEDSILAIQIFDQKKFKKKDQGFLGVINVRVGDNIDFSIGGDGTLLEACLESVPCDGKC